MSPKERKLVGYVTGIAQMTFAFEAKKMRLL